MLFKFMYQEEYFLRKTGEENLTKTHHEIASKKMLKEERLAMPLKLLTTHLVHGHKDGDKCILYERIRTTCRNFPTSTPKKSNDRNLLTGRGGDILFHIEKLPFSSTPIESKTHLQELPLFADDGQSLMWPTFSLNKLNAATSTPLNSEQAQESNQREQQCTAATITVKWPSGTRSKTLSNDLHQLSKKLLRGRYDSIAASVWRHEELRKHIIKLFLKKVNLECEDICKSKDPSILRKTGKEDMLNFTFTSFDNELQERAPILRSVLMTAALRRTMKPEEDLFWQPAVCTAAADAGVKWASIENGHFTVENTSTVVSHAYLNRKLDEFGRDHDKSIKDAIELESKRLQMLAIESNVTDSSEVDQPPKPVSLCQPAAVASSINWTKESITAIDIDQQPSSQKLMVFGNPSSMIMGNVGQTREMLREKKNEPCTSTSVTKSGFHRACSRSLPAPDMGRKIVFDNLDWHMPVHHMTEEHQNIDQHYTVKMSVSNRVGVARIITKNIHCLQFLQDVVDGHIPHKHSKEMSIPTDNTFLGIVYASENTADGIMEVLKDMQQYQPCFGEGEEKVYGTQGYHADQLSVERGVNAVMQVCNAFTPCEKFSGMHFEIADFHTSIKFMQVAFDHFYNTSAFGDQCTLFSDRNLINRRNVVSEVKRKVSACKSFLDLELDARVTAATLHFMKLTDLDGIPSEEHLPTGIMASKRQNKQEFLYTLASEIVDKYILQHDKMSKQLALHIEMELERDEEKKLVTKEGRFKCRWPDCTKTYAILGKSKAEHELKEHGLTARQMFKGSDDKHKSLSDDMHNYQCAFMEYGMILRNFHDAISEGDGQRILRSWKFMLPYLKVDGNSSSKYALEGFYIISQAYSLLTPKDAHRLIWNRFVKNKRGPGGNISLDLALEHYIRLLKLIMKKLGANATNKSILDRYTKALAFNKLFMDNFDNMSAVIKRSGKHVKKAAESDLKKVVKELILNDAFSIISGRKYKHFRDVKGSLLHNLHVTSLFAWINTHKRKIILQKTAR
eukprot:gene1047-373_t